MLCQHVCQSQTLIFCISFLVWCVSPIRWHSHLSCVEFKWNKSFNITILVIITWHQQSKTSLNVVITCVILKAMIWLVSWNVRKGCTFIILKVMIWLISWNVWKGCSFLYWKRVSDWLGKMSEKDVHLFSDWLADMPGKDDTQFMSLINISI